MARRPRNRLELREQYEAAEKREQAEKLEAELGEAVADDGSDDSGEIKTKKKKAAKKAIGEAKPRKSKAKAVTRKRIVWVVYDNSHKEVARFPYLQRKEAEEKAEQLKTDKKQTYFVQPFKEEIKETTSMA
ncbi:MAG: hypothetical protein SNJ82_02195 [Gemmataceae bacterium]